MEPGSNSLRLSVPQRSQIVPAGQQSLDELDVPLSILAVLAVTGTTSGRVAVPGDWISELAKLWLQEVVAGQPPR